MASPSICHAEPLQSCRKYNFKSDAQLNVHRFFFNIDITKKPPAEAGGFSADDES